MAQFDVFRNPDGGRFPLLVDLQADVVSQLATRVVAPLMTRKRHGKPINRLNPIIDLGGTEYVIVFQELAPVPTAVLVERVGSLASRRSELIAAVDLLFTGI